MISANAMAGPLHRLDISQARKRFEFASLMLFEDGMRRTIDWYRQRDD